MQKEFGFDNQFNNIKSFALMVNNAVQTSDDMRDMIVKYYFLLYIYIYIYIIYYKQIY